MRRLRRLRRRVIGPTRLATSPSSLSCALDLQQHGLRSASTIAFTGAGSLQNSSVGAFLDVAGFSAASQFFGDGRLVVHNGFFVSAWSGSSARSYLELRGGLASIQLANAFHSGVVVLDSGDGNNDVVSGISGTLGRLVLARSAIAGGPTSVALLRRTGNTQSVSPASNWQSVGGCLPYGFQTDVCPNVP